jgi:AcrR family transcriptional regulator
MLLRQALLDLIEEREFDAITVGELARRAMVSRAAFYRHYQSKDHLAEQIFEETIRAMVDDFDPLRREVLHRSAVAPSAKFWEKFFEQALQFVSLPGPWVRLFEHVAENERLYRILLGKKGRSWFGPKVRTYLSEVINERFQTLELNGNRLAERHVFADGFVSALLTGLLVDAIIWWLEQGKPYPPSQAATYCSRLFYVVLKEAAMLE